LVSVADQAPLVSVPRLRVIGTQVPSTLTAALAGAAPANQLAQTSTLADCLG